MDSMVKFAVVGSDDDGGEKSGDVVGTVGTISTKGGTAFPIPRSWRKQVAAWDTLHFLRGERCGWQPS